MITLSTSECCRDILLPNFRLFFFFSLYLSSVGFYHPSMFIPFFFWEIDECSTYCKWPYKTIANNAMNLFFPQQWERNRFTNGTFWGKFFKSELKCTEGYQVILHFCFLRKRILWYIYIMVYANISKLIMNSSVGIRFPLFAHNREYLYLFN